LVLSLNLASLKLILALSAMPDYSII